MRIFYWTLGNSELNDAIKHNLKKNTTYVKVNQQYVQKPDMVKFPLYVRPQWTEGPMKLLLPDCTSLLWFVNLVFFLGLVD